MEYWIAFTIGFLGSLHCVGMCGPIAFALPLNRSSNQSLWLGTIIYNLGRLSTYATLGFVFGILGYGLAFAGFQQKLSILIGVGMIVLIISPMLFSKVPKFFSKWNLWLGAVKGALSKRFGSSSFSNLFSIGLLNGLLPCGLVYLGIAGSAAMGSALSGSAFMVFFGIGTIPLLLSVSLFKANLSLGLRNRFKQLRPLLLLIIATLFVLRGMNLGIPYLSPELQNESTEIISCHKPE